MHNVSSMKVTQDCIHVKWGEFIAQRNAKSVVHLELLNSFQTGESMSGYFQI